MIRVSGSAMLASALLLLLAAEWLLRGAALPPLSPPPSISALSANPAAKLGIANWARTILARPLLRPDRRAVLQASLMPDLTLPRLSAIIITGGRRCAIFSNPGEKPQCLAAGSKVGSYQLQSVASDSVGLFGPGGRITLRPQYISGPATHLQGGFAKQ